jgi:hypothetical protein
MNGYRVSPEFDPIAAADVAAAHQEAPRIGGALAGAAYARLVGESDQLFQRITQASTPVQIVFTLSPRPYCGADELITSIRRDRILEITTASPANVTDLIP